VALLRSVGGASLPLLFWLLLTLNDPPLAPPLLLRLFLIWIAAPLFTARLIQRVYAVEMRVAANQLEVVRRDVRIEVPFDSIQRFAPWRIPLPCAGLSVQLQSGRHLRWGLALEDPSGLVASIARISPALIGTAATHPTIIYAHAKAMHSARRLSHLLAKFAGFALLPATVLFYTHQSIAHGGPLGEYYTFGLRAYLTTYAVYWSTIAIYLVLYASVWRGATELVCLLTAWIAPLRTVGVRRIAELASTLLYYAGVPVILALRYLG
jgi:apolipoprotein N-acyltransferase